MIAEMTLAYLVATCAPTVGRITMRSVVAYESGERPFAIGDNTMHRSYFPRDGARAIGIATALLRAHHNIDVGYTQINSENFARLGLRVATAFDPCRNIGGGARILTEAYRGAVRRYGPGQLALIHALSAYNSGGYYAGLDYARGVYATAGRAR